MSWFSSAWDSIKSVGSKVVSIAKKVVTPLASFAVGLIPGVGPMLSKGVDMLGGALMGDAEDPTSAAGQVEQAPVQQYMAATTGQAMGLGSSPAAMALASATSQVEEEVTNSAKGFLGIGDGKPGVFGIGTGKNKVRKQAEDAARGDGLSPKAVKLAGDTAVAGIPEKVKGTDSNDKPGGSGAAGLALPIIGGILALLLL